MSSVRWLCLRFIASTARSFRQKRPGSLVHQLVIPTSRYSIVRRLLSPAAERNYIGCRKSGKDTASGWCHFLISGSGSEENRSHYHILARVHQRHLLPSTCTEPSSYAYAYDAFYVYTYPFRNKVLVSTAAFQHFFVFGQRPCYSDQDNRTFAHNDPCCCVPSADQRHTLLCCCHSIQRECRQRGCHPHKKRRQRRAPLFPWWNHNWNISCDRRY